MAARYEVYICDKNGVRQRPVRVSEIKGDIYKYNKVSTLDFSIDKRQVTSLNLYPGKNEIAVYRNEVHIFQGPIVDIMGYGNKKTLDVRAKDLKYYLSIMQPRQNIRYMDNITDHVWRLLSYRQGLSSANNRGITLGTQIGSAPQTTTQFLIMEGKSLLDLQETLGGSIDKNIFDWEITPGRAYQTIYPPQETTANFHLEFPGTIIDYDYIITTDGMSNYYVAQGASETKDNNVTYYNTTSMNTYGTYDKFIKFSDAKNRSVLFPTASKDFTLKIHPLIYMNPVVRSDAVNPFNNDVKPSQWIKVIIDDSYISYNDVLQYYGFGLTWNLDTSETFTYYLRGKYEE